MTPGVERIVIVSDRLRWWDTVDCTSIVCSGNEASYNKKTEV